MKQKFILKIGSSVGDFNKTIDLRELQGYTIIIDPIENFHAKLFVGKQELQLEQIYKPEKPFFKFKTRYKFENVGIQVFRLEINSENYEQKVRVKPIKISQKDYENILEQIQASAYNIIFQTFGKTEEEIRLLKINHPKSPIEFFYFFEKNFMKFKNIFQRIKKSPNVIIENRLQQKKFFETEDFEEVIDYQKPTIYVTYLQDKLNGLLPKTVLVSENYLSYDVYENRLLKHFLGLIVNKLNFLEDVATKEKKREETNKEVFGGTPNTDAKFDERIREWADIITKCRKYRDETFRMRSSSFLSSVKNICLVKTSMVLQKEPRYKAFYKLYQEFRKNSVIEISSGYFHLPVTESWKIYEIWVLFQMYEILRQLGFNLKKQGLLNLNTKYLHNAKKVSFSFNLTKNKPLLQFTKEGRTAKLYYQRRYETKFTGYGSIDEQCQIPDMVIEIFEEKQTIPRIVIVDPKYRITGSKPPKSAKTELSHYKETIRDSLNRRLVSSAYVIYPGKLSKSFGKNKDFGYLGLTPNSDMEEFKQEIAEIIG